MPNISRAKELEKLIPTLLKRTAGVLTWEWDAQFGAGLTVFDQAKSPAAHELLRQAFATAWDAGSIGGAPAGVSELVKSLGGLRPGQMLFVSHADGGSALFAAWWPWGGGKRISVRLGMHAPAEPEAARAALLETLRAAFGG